MVLRPQKPTETGMHPAVNPSAWKSFEIHEVGKTKEFVILTFTNRDLRPPQVIRQLESELLRMLAHVKAPYVVLDFTEVKYAPSAFFGIVMETVAEGKKLKKEVRLCCLTPMIEKAFMLLNTGGLVRVFSTRRAAVETSDENKKWWQVWKKG